MAQGMMDPGLYDPFYTGSDYDEEEEDVVLVEEGGQQQSYNQPRKEEEVMEVSASRYFTPLINVTAALAEGVLSQVQRRTHRLRYEDLRSKKKKDRTSEEQDEFEKLKKVLLLPLHHEVKKVEIDVNDDFPSILRILRSERSEEVQKLDAAKHANARREKKFKKKNDFSLIKKQHDTFLDQFKHYSFKTLKPDKPARAKAEGVKNAVTVPYEHVEIAPLKKPKLKLKTSHCKVEQRRRKVYSYPPQVNQHLPWAFTVDPHYPAQVTSAVGITK